MSYPWQLALGINTPTTVVDAGGRIQMPDPTHLDILGGNSGDVLQTDGTGGLHWVSMAASATVEWGSVLNKPATFPPTLPIPISGVSGLQAALDATPGTITALNTDVTAAGTGAVVATVTALQGRSVFNTTPSDGQVLQWSLANNRWQPATLPGAGTVTQVSAGAGITVSPSPITGAGSVSLTVPVAAALGGTGLTTYAQGDLIYASAANALAALPKTTTTPRYLSNSGASQAPAWAAIDLALGVTGVLPVANGGTGASTGAVGPYLPLVAGSGNALTGNLTISPASGDLFLTLKKAASGVSASIIGSTGSVNRWEVQLGDRAAESSGNAGSNFTVNRFNDAGTYIDTPFSISRSTGVASFGSNVRLAGNYLTFADATPAGINTTSDGPFIYGDQSYLIFHQGTSNLGWRFQDKNGANIAIINSATGQFDIAGLIACPQINVQQGAATVFMQLINSAAAWNVQVEPSIGEFELRYNGAGAVRLAVRTDGTCFCTTGTWSAISDIATKRDVQPYTRGLADLVQLEPVMFKYNGAGGTTDDGRQMYGLVAQQVQPVVPEIVNPTLAGDEELLGVDSGRLTFAMLNALREINERLCALEDR